MIFFLFLIAQEDKLPPRSQKPMPSGIMLVRYTFAIQMSSTLKVPVNSEVKLISESKYIQIRIQMQQQFSSPHLQTVTQLPRIPISSHERCPPMKHGLKSINDLFFKKILRDLIVYMPVCWHIQMYAGVEEVRRWCLSPRNCSDTCLSTV